MTSADNDSYHALAEKIKLQVSLNSEITKKCKSHLQLSLLWTARFLDRQEDIHCRQLLRGSYGAAVEAISLLSFGLIRPAVLSLRSHYELSLQFLFYKDHPVEWRNVASFRAQPTLPAANKQYLKNNFPLFEERFKELIKKKKRKHEECYDILSGVAHGTALNSISSATKPSELVEPSEAILQTESVFLSASEYLHDIHVAAFESNWLSLPSEVQDNLNNRFCPSSPMAVLKF